MGTPRFSLDLLLNDEHYGGDKHEPKSQEQTLQDQSSMNSCSSKPLRAVKGNTHLTVRESL